MRSRFPWRKRRALLLDPRPTFRAEALGRAFAINRSASAPRPKQKAAQLGLCRSRLSRGQHVSKAPCGAEQHERDYEAPYDLEGAASTRWTRGPRWRQWLERGHRPDWPNPRGAALVGVCPGHPKSYVADFTADERPSPPVPSHPFGDFEGEPAEDGDTDAPEKHDRDHSLLLLFTGCVRP